MIIINYVDDLILIGDEFLIHSCKADLAKEFEMKDLRLLHYSWDWKFGSGSVDYLRLKESMPGRYWRISTCKAASLSTLLFLVVGGKRMLHWQR